MKTSNKLLLNLVFIFTFCVASSSFARTGLFAALGPSYTGVSVFKVLYNEWEIGLLASGKFGFNKSFFTSTTYASFGSVLSNNTLGFFGAAGWSPELFWGLNFRAELYAVMDIESYSSAAAQVGLSYYF